MSYEVIRPFKDKTDKDKRYKPKDSYSHKDQERIATLQKRGFLQSKSKQPPKEEKKASE